MEILKAVLTRGGCGFLLATALASGVAAGCSTVKTTEGGAIGIDEAAATVQWA